MFSRTTLNMFLCFFKRISTIRVYTLLYRTVEIFKKYWVLFLIILCRLLAKLGGHWSDTFSFFILSQNTFCFSLFTLVSTILPLSVGALFTCNSLDNNRETKNKIKVKKKHISIYNFWLSCGSWQIFCVFENFPHSVFCLILSLFLSLTLHINILLS